MYKAIKDNKIIAISDTDSEFLCLVKDSVETDDTHTVDDYKLCDTEYVLINNEKAIEQMKSEVRAVRNSYLEEYVDPKQLVLVWDSMNEGRKAQYAGYRQYLLDYPESGEDWYKQNPMTFDEWVSKNQEE